MSDTDKLIAQTRAKIEQARLVGGPLREALVRGHGCCFVNDREFDQALWDAALAESERVVALADAAEAQRDTLAEAIETYRRQYLALDNPLQKLEKIQRLVAVLDAVTPPEKGPPPGYVVPEGDERCGYVMDACQCMKRRGHDGLHGCAHGGWRAAPPPEDLP